MQSFPDILTASNIQLSYGKRTLLDDVTVSLGEQRIVGLVGANGAGKSSFLKILARKIDPDGGQVILGNQVTLAYVSQENDFNEGEMHQNVLEYISDIAHKIHTSSHDRSLELVQSDIQTLMNLFDVSSLVGVVKNLSGGEQRRLSLVTTLALKPDILLLDEPTNHLDLPTIETLQKWLPKSKISCIIVSHDRYFLDQIAQEMWEIDSGQLYVHNGNYSAFLDSRTRRLANASVKHERDVQLMNRELEWVRAGVKARGTKDKGRLKRFSELEQSIPKLNREVLQPVLPEPAPLGTKILNFINPTVLINHKTIVQNLDFSFQAGNRLGLIGPNGSGKTTLIKSILGQFDISQGKIVVGQNTEFNVIDQNRTDFNPEATVFEEIGNGLEQTKFGQGTIGTRAYLQRFLFGPERIMTPVKLLSGGERARLALAKTFQKGGNFLILDEPTNDLDLDTLRVLEESLEAFEGCAIIISHDRYFLNRTCNYILALGVVNQSIRSADPRLPDKPVTQNFVLSTGNYDDFISKLDKTNNPQGFSVSKGLSDRGYMKHVQQQIYAKNQQLKKYEQQIAKLEEKLTTLQAKFADPEFYSKHANELPKLNQQLNSLQTELDLTYNSWLELQS